MNSFKLYSLFVVLLVIVAVSAVTDVPVAVVMSTPTSATPSAAINEVATSQLVAQRLRKMWPGRDVGIIAGNADGVLTNADEDVHEMINRMSSKYSVYDHYNIAETIGKRKDIANSVDPDITISGKSPIQDDYMSVIHNANTREFNAKVDNPDNLEMMLSSLWGKRFGNMNAEQKEEAARNEKVLIIRGTSTETERMSQANSADGSVQKFIARPDDVAELDPPKPEGPYKPKSEWFGPRIYGTALDVSDQKAPQEGKRTPNDPPKPPVQSFVFPDYHVNTTDPNSSPITIIETIRVTRDGATRAKPKPEPTFIPIMTDDLKGKTKKTWIV